MVRNIFIDGTDCRATFGVWVLKGGYDDLFSFPAMKEPDTNDWAEHDGEECAAARGDLLWKLDVDSAVRFSHENTDVQTLYKDYLGTPCGEKAHHLLHTDHESWTVPPKREGVEY
ncbi:MAG: iron hydrogenase small subunit [Thermoguttaceae bacterium]|nr:iron hydrogenase small subunit [Thermoguttaceae bacterium]